ncbi:type 4b pilus protein PilO2 [Agrobacterium rubi]|nr:type 4b pilus protein PilO2 [Agrobacterium rubi]NTF24216.1 type 4b pilus protein PilO2 [Agrobacterium rubi]
MSNMDDGFGIDSMEDSSLGESSSYIMRVGVIRVNKRDYAVGLQWNTLEDPSRGAEEARAYASMPSVMADFFGVRQSSSPQFALGFKSYGHKSNMPSLAAHAAREKGGSWLGLFEVAGGYYLLAVRDDAIISEFDRFYEDREAALRAFDEVRYMTWDETIAPASMKVDQTSSLTLDTLLAGKPPVKLGDVRKTSPIIKFCLLGFFAVGVFFAYSTYMEGVNQKALDEQAAELARQAASLVTQTPEEEPIPEMPWVNLPQGAKLLEKCVGDVRQFRLSIPGWSVNDFFCSSSSVSAAAAIDRKAMVGAGGGSVNWIRPYVEREGFKPSITFPPEGSGSRVRAEWPLADVPMIPVDINTVKIRKIRESLLTVFEDRMTPIKFSDADSNLYWRGLAFDFETKIDPLAYSDILSAIPGLIVDDVTYSVKTNTWQVKGRAYEQLPLPKKNP